MVSLLDLPFIRPESRSILDRARLGVFMSASFMVASIMAIWSPTRSSSKAVRMPSSTSDFSAANSPAADRPDGTMPETLLRDLGENKGDSHQIWVL